MTKEEKEIEDSISVNECFVRDYNKDTIIIMKRIVGQYEDVIQLRNMDGEGIVEFPTHSMLILAKACKLMFKEI